MISTSVPTEILYLAAYHGFKFVPAAGPNWKGDFDRGKQPLTSIYEATTDPARLAIWAEKYHACNCLFVPGAGQAVLDVDPRHGGDTALRELEAHHGPMPCTTRVRTGRGDGGGHWYFAVPEDVSFDADLAGKGLTLSTGGKRGFVVPPCKHATGGYYSWEFAPWDVPPAPCPAWLLALGHQKSQTPAPPLAAQRPRTADCMQFTWGGGERLADHPGEAEGEFGAVITKSRRDGSTLGPTLCNAWDGRTLEVANRGGAKLKAEGHHTTIWANITGAELEVRLCKGLESVNGFGNRFLWVRQVRQRYLPRGGDLRCLENLAGRLRDTLTRAKGIGEVRWTDEAAIIWDEAYRRLCDVQERHWSLGRARAQALRVTLLFALLDGCENVSPEHVRAGLSAWAWCEASSVAIFSQASPEPSKAIGTSQLVGGVAPEPKALPGAAPRPQADCPLEVQALARIQARPGLKRGELLKAMGKGVNAETLARVLGALEPRGVAEGRKTPGKGRTAECWCGGPAA